MKGARGGGGSNHTGSWTTNKRVGLECQDVFHPEELQIGRSSASATETRGGSHEIHT